MFWWWLLACSGGDPADTSEPGDSDSAATEGEIDLPDSPFPLELQLDGAESLTFDGLTCNHPPNQQLQLTYHSTGSWSLRVFVREAFTGAGTYSTDVDVQLFENFTGGRYYTGDQDSGASVEIEAVGTNGAHGSFTVDALTSDLGEGVLSPQPVPIWCDALVEE